MKPHLTLLIIYFATTYSLSQTFSGRLTYNYTAHDSIKLEESYRLIKFDGKSAYTMRRTVWVKKDSMREVTANDYGRLDWAGYQLSQQRHCNMSNNDSGYKTYRRLSFPTLPKIDRNLILLEKSKTTVSILGYDCREHLYKYLYTKPPFSDRNIIVKIWIPTKFKFKKQHSYGNDFEFYFFPDGLAFKREDYTNGKLMKSYELTNILFYDVPNDQFDDCEKVVKENE
jgi:hypothetical protein